MKPKITTGRTSRARAPGKPKVDPRQAELPNTQAEGEVSSDASAPTRPAMKLPEVLAELENAAKPLNVRVTYEAIGGELGAGGLCKVKGHWRVIIDKRTTPSERVSVLAASLARFDFASVPLSPQVKELLLRFAPTAAPATPPADPASAAPADAAVDAPATAQSSADGPAEAAADAPAEESPVDREPSSARADSARSAAGGL